MMRSEHESSSGSADLTERLRLIVGWYKEMISERTGRSSRFYEDVERRPRRQATVELACALEGVNDAYAIASREHGTRRLRIYGHSIGIALTRLLRAQRLIKSVHGRHARTGTNHGGG
jgi:hypothetical protein